MPIITIEGPDKCGKSTLFAGLRDIWIGPTFVDPPPYGKSRMSIAAQLAERDLELWETFYEPTKLYVANRHVIVSDAVYSNVYDRPTLRYSWIRKHLFVVYIEVSCEELRHRCHTCSEDVQSPEQYAIVKEYYKLVLKDFPHIVVGSTHTPMMVKELLNGR